MKDYQNSSFILKIVQVKGKQQFFLQNIKSGERKVCDSWEEVKHFLLGSLELKGLR